MPRVLCDTCLEHFLFNMSRDELLILEYLYKIQACNPLLSVEKNKIIENVSGMTDFKFTVAVSALEARMLIDTGKSKKPIRYFLNADGESLLKMFVKALKEQQEQIEKMKTGKAEN